MRSGPKPTPSGVRKLNGNPGHRAFNAREPEFPPFTAEAIPVPPATPEAEADMPTELRSSPVAMQEWRRLLPLLTTARVLTAADRTALVALCQEWARYVEATAKIATVGMVVRTPSGYPITNPYLSIANRALNQCKQLWAEFGLTPSSRTRIATDGPGPGGDAFSEFDDPKAPTTAAH